jgi:hypothetical protein
MFSGQHLLYSIVISLISFCFAHVALQSDNMFPVQWPHSGRLKPHRALVMKQKKLLALMSRTRPSA